MSGELIQRAFDDYLDAESGLALRRLHARIVEDPTFIRPTPWFDRATRLLEQDRWDEAIRVINRFMPGLWLSPDAHLMLAHAYTRIRDEERGRLAAFHANAALGAIDGSGSGTESAPWLVLQVPDEYAYLRHLGLRPQRQRTLRTGDALVDVHDCSDGSVRWFELVS